MSSLEIYNPEKTTGYVVDEYVNYDKSIYRCRVDTPKPAGPFNDEYWNLTGYILEGSGIVNYDGKNTELNFDDPDKFIYSDRVNNIEKQGVFKLKNMGISVSENPETSNYGLPIYFADKDGITTGYVRNGKQTNGSQYVGLQAVRTVDETERYASLDIGIKTDGTAYCNWQGNQIATTNNVVDLSSTQTITGTKTFNNGKLYATNPHLVKQNTSLEGGEIYFDAADNEPNATKSISIDRYNGQLRFLGSASTDSSQTGLLNLDFQNKKSTITGPLTVTGALTVSTGSGIKGRFRTAEAWQDDNKSAKWFYIGNFDSKSTYHTQTIVFKLQATSSSSLSQGLATGKIVTRTGGSGSGSEGTCNYAKIIFDNPIPQWLDPSNVALLYKENLTDSSNNKYVNFQLWIKSVATWESYVFIIENEQTGHNYSTDWTFYTKKSSAGQCQDGLPGSGTGYTQAFSIISNTNRNASGDGIYDWMGTLAQYNAQNIATTHPEWLCFITDDHTATAYSAYSKTESDSRYVKTADIDNKWKTLLNTLYPKGSVYIGTQSSCPLQTLISGSTWVLVSKGCSLWGGNGSMYDNATPGTTTNANYANAQANTTIAAGLPNITGSIGYLTSNTTADIREESKNYGAFRWEGYGTTNGGTASQNRTFDVTFNASRSNSIYSKSTTVQPPAYVVNVWRRTA